MFELSLDDSIPVIETMGLSKHGFAGEDLTQMHVIYALFDRGGIDSNQQLQSGHCWNASHDASN
jgi:hypothetical protein